MILLLSKVRKAKRWPGLNAYLGFCALGHLLNLSVSFLVPSKTGDDPSKAEDERYDLNEEKGTVYSSLP